MTKKAFITGNSSGLGRGISVALLDRGYRIYGCSRRGCDLSGMVEDITCDLSDFNAIPNALNTLLHGVDDLQLVVLNAGMLGSLQDMQEASLEDLKRIMDINVWSNKIIFDWLLESAIPVECVLLISSGAAVLGNRGWGGYAMSKAALNMLGRLYAHEFPNTQIISLAPGLINTAMIDYLCDEADSDRFPALQRLHKARGMEKIQSPLEAAEKILSILPRLQEYASGSFVDMREILAPLEYHELMKGNNASEKVR